MHQQRFNDSLKNIAGELAPARYVPRTQLLVRGFVRQSLEKLCSVPGSWRATTLPLLSQRVIALSGPGPLTLRTVYERWRADALQWSFLFEKWSCSPLGVGDELAFV